MDISAELLPLAMAKGCCENGVVGNSDESLALDAGSFDAIIFVGLFSYVEKFDMCFDEMVRLARPGALFIFSHRANWWAEDYRGYAASGSLFLGPSVLRKGAKEGGSQR